MSNTTTKTKTDQIVLTEEMIAQQLGDCYVPLESEDKEAYINAINKFLNKIPDFNLPKRSWRDLHGYHWARDYCRNQNVRWIDYRFFLKNPSIRPYCDNQGAGYFFAIVVNADNEKFCIVKRSYYSPPSKLHTRLGIKLFREIYTLLVRDILSPSFFARRYKAWGDKMELLKTSQGVFFPLRQNEYVLWNGITYNDRTCEIRGKKILVSFPQKSNKKVNISTSTVYHNNISDVYNFFKNISFEKTATKEEIMHLVDKQHEEERRALVWNQEQEIKKLENLFGK